MTRARARRLVLLLAALTALVLAGCGVGTTSAMHGLGVQDRVGALTPAAQLLVRTQAAGSACSRLGSSVSGPEAVAGFCVAAEDAGTLSAAASSRAEELQASLPAGSRGRVTMAVGVGRDEAGNVRTIVGTSEPGGYLRPGVSLNAGEELATGSLHAEQNIIGYGGPFTNPFYIAAGRPICPICAAAIEESGATPASPLR